MAASAAAESWIFPMHPVPAQQPADQSRNDSVAIGCKHAYYLERTVFFLQVLRAIHVAFISFLIIDGWVGGWVGGLHYTSFGKILFLIYASTLIHFHWDMFWCLAVSCHQYCLCDDYVSHWRHVEGTKCVRAAFTSNFDDYKYRLFLKTTASWYSTTLVAVVVRNANGELDVLYVLRHVVKCLFSRSFFLEWGAWGLICLLWIVVE